MHGLTIPTPQALVVPLRAARMSKLSMARGLSLLVLSSVGGCPSPIVAGDSGPRPDVGGCGSAAECDDSVACTLDSCEADRSCSHVADDTRCAAGETCEATGCAGPEECTASADCMVGRGFCDGLFACRDGTCEPFEPRDCDDSNACTMDSCDPTLAGGVGACRHTATCDGGVSDAGACSDPFVPATDYTGSYLVFPNPSSGCGGLAPNYRVTGVAFAVSGGMLRVTATPGLADVPFVMTGAVPTGSSFDVQFGDGCFSGHLTGEFSCNGRFSGTFVGAYSGSCSTCAGGAATVQGFSG